MKVSPECLSCLVETAVKQARLATGRETLRFKALSEFLSYLSQNFSEDSVPASLGSDRNKIIRRVTGSSDPYEELKNISNKSAREIKPFAEEIVEAGGAREERIKRALRVAAVANSMEFGVSSHDFDPDKFKEEFEDLVEKDLNIDDSSEFVSRLESSEEIIYLTDNCGEIVLDQILMDEIRDLGVNLLIGVKSQPVQEDVTLDVAESLGLGRFGKVFPTGDLVGLSLEELSENMKSEVENADLIIGKGMGNFETISEFEGKLENRLMYILRAKCRPVADTLGVERGDLVIKMK